MSNEPHIHIITTPDASWQTRAPGAEPVSAQVCNLRSRGRHPHAWEGFGGCFNEIGWDALLRLAPASRSSLLDGLFSEDGLHLDMGRLPMGASDYALSWHSYDETEGDLALNDFSIARDRERLFPFVHEALARRPDLRLFASPWSPPTWMKFPAAYNYGTFRMEPEYLASYADYFVRYVEACAVDGIHIGSVHPQNEPVADQKFPSCVWTGDELAEFIGGYLGPAMAARFPEVGVWLGTMNTADFENMFLPVLSDPRCSGILRGIGLQWDGKNVLQKLAAACPELPRWQTENECGDGLNTRAYAHGIFSLVSHYLSSGVNAYVYWNMALPPGGRSTWGWEQNSLAVVDGASGEWSWQPEYYVFKHLAHFVRPGDFPLQLDGMLAPCAVAFERAAGGHVLAIHNPQPQPVPLHAEIGGKEIVAKLEPDSFHTFVL